MLTDIGENGYAFVHKLRRTHKSSARDFN